MTAFFVTATGTDIGKTFVTAGLVRWLRGQGVGAAAIKPVVSGLAPGALAASDCAVLLAAMGEAITPEAAARISPWQFTAPLSPDMAAAREGRTIDFGALLEFCRSRLPRSEDLLFIEGVGGVLVPLDDKHTVRDWIRLLGIPAIVVTGSYLGTISHTLTAVEALAHAGIACAMIVIDESADSPVSLEDTRAALGRFVPAVPVMLMHRNEEDAKADFAALGRQLV